MIIKRKLVNRISRTHKFPYSRSLTATATATAAPILKVEIGSFYIPKHNPSKPLGEDAHFVFSDKLVAGVADGVGGWASKGIDAGVYARELIGNCVVAVSGDTGAVVKPKRVLTEAHSRTTAAGSSTACIVSFDGGFLRAANVGDSGFMIFRGGMFSYRSPVQRRGFNRPCQMGVGEKYDKPAAAWSGKIQIAAGDVIVIGTDGLFDNVFAKEIEDILVAEVAVDTAEDLAGLLAELALCNSSDTVNDGPFAEEAREAGRIHRGGKIDDITVIVAKVTAS
ncbi:probable protein phosphatase 2C 55 [Cucurbita pepo subsp. pepo]|uniref:probable protein phosphatase 2C 55 n=1 Tax=Cucurbita pepo subsp. pepo TaxID=3664 RepID=UPI000C9D4669|nr:probable protein phosphatase 2C 55 [Cucurbita pepo subsp. pepo]